MCVCVSPPPVVSAPQGQFLQLKNGCGPEERGQLKGRGVALHFPSLRSKFGLTDVVPAIPEEPKTARLLFPQSCSGRAGPALLAGCGFLRGSQCKVTGSHFKASPQLLPSEQRSRAWDGRSAGGQVGESLGGTGKALPLTQRGTLVVATLLSGAEGMDRCMGWAAAWAWARPVSCRKGFAQLGVRCQRCSC